MEKDIRFYNVGSSDYTKHKIQPWDIWLEYHLNPWEADIVKRVLRHKEGQSRREDFEKIVHIAQECIRQIDAGEYYDMSNKKSLFSCRLCRKVLSLFHSNKERV